jgi:hypothetical protein
MVMPIRHQGVSLMHRLELLPPVPGLRFDEPSHTYTVEHKHLGVLTVPSTTQVMAATGAKCLNYSAWRNSLLRNGICQTDEQADAFMESHRSHRAMVGTQLHHLIETYLLGREPMDADPEAEKMFQTWLKDFYPRITTVFVVEEPMLHRAYFYCGTPDLLAEVDGAVTLTDWKSQQQNKEKVRSEWGLQVGAYCELVRACHGITVAKATMAIVTVDNVRLAQYNRADIVQGWSRFAGFLAEHHALQAKLGSLPHHIALTAMESLFA